MDFTLNRYRELLSALLRAGYKIMPYNAFLKNDIDGKKVIMRHDVDSKEHALDMAKIELEMGVRASYYFRAVPESWDERLIREIAAMGHEIGFHYESLTTSNGDVDKAYEDFCHNIEALRQLASVETICMHGSPRSKYDSKDIWKKFDYHILGIIGEPYFDTDFSKVFYLTDTGRRWDGYKVSVRDKVEGQQKIWKAKGLVFRHTKDIIEALGDNRLPDKIMFTVHPPRWNDSIIAWTKQLILQNIKNEIKRLIIIIRK